MIPVCLYFQVHQPYRLRRYNYFDVGREHRYFDDDVNRDLLASVASRCYSPAASFCERLLEEHPRFAVSFSFSGTVLEQLRAWAPEALAAFRRLAASDRVEILAETSTTRSRGSPRARSSRTRSCSTGGSSSRSSA